jgi:hypothetical protein
VFNRKPKEEPHALDETITNLISEIAGLETGSELYTSAVESLKVLIELRISEKEFAKPAKISPDMITSAVTNLLGIGMILGFEKANVITSKSLSFIPKMKI